MPVYDVGASWQININHARGKNGRIKRNFPKSQYSKEQVIAFERDIRRDLCGPAPGPEGARQNTVGAIVDLYLQHSENHDLPVTFKDKRWMLLNYVVPFFGNMPIDGISGPMFDQYIKKRKEQIRSKCATASGNRRINLELLALSAMSKWACSKEVGLGKERLKVPQLKYRRPLPQVWTREELARLFEQFKPRDKALYLCLYHAGLRKTEAMKLTWNRVNFEDGTILVTGKGDRQRIIAMSRTLYAAMWSWATLHKSPEVIFPSSHTKKTLTNIRKPLLTAVKKSGVKKRMYPHLLRHCFGTHTLAAGGDLRVIQAAMGHQQVTTTEIYTHVAIEQKKKLVAGLD